jgi:hypothetical protein
VTAQELELLLRTWQQRLRLDRWDLRLVFDMPISEDADAEIRVHDQYDQASIRIGPKYVSWSPANAEAVIVHELVHVFEKRVRSTATAAGDALPAAAREVHWQWYEIVSEQMVENLTLVLLSLVGAELPQAPREPLPDAPPATPADG